MCPTKLKEGACMDEKCLFSHNHLEIDMVTVEEKIKELTHCIKYVDYML
jgi:hypothetical protein